MARSVRASCWNHLGEMAIYVKWKYLRLSWYSLVRMRSCIAIAGISDIKIKEVRDGRRTYEEKCEFVSDSQICISEQKVFSWLLYKGPRGVSVCLSRNAPAIWYIQRDMLEATTITGFVESCITERCSRKVTGRESLYEAEGITSVLFVYSS